MPQEQALSILSFFNSPSKSRSAASHEDGISSTSLDLEAAPLGAHWNPGRHYEETEISILQPIRGVEWSRNDAPPVTKQERPNPTCPERVFDLDTALSSPLRLLYSFADIDERVRLDPTESFIGFLSVMILDMNIMTFHLQNMLFSSECCDIPLYTNATFAKCQLCEEQVPLRLNPSIVGTVIDETGCIAQGKLIWTPQAWEELLGRTAQEFASSRAELLRYMEKRLSFLRVTLIFGWAADGEGETGGRLCVLGVRM